MKKRRGKKLKIKRQLYMDLYGLYTPAINILTFLKKKTRKERKRKENFKWTNTPAINIPTFLKKKKKRERKRKPLMD